MRTHWKEATYASYSSSFSQLKSEKKGCSDPLFIQKADGNKQSYASNKHNQFDAKPNNAFSLFRDF